MKQFLGKVKFWMDKFLSIACAVLLSFMTILVLIQVFSRYVLNSPVAFTEELVRYSLIWTGFIGAAYAFSTREHMSLTLVRDKFTGKAHTRSAGCHRRPDPAAGDLRHHHRRLQAGCFCQS